MDGKELILKYYEEIIFCNFWDNRGKIADIMIWISALCNLLIKKGIITKDEFDEGVSTAKKHHEETTNLIEKELELHKNKKENLEKEIKKHNEEQEKMNETMKEIFGIDLNNLKF